MLEALVIILMFLFPAVGMAWTDNVSTKSVGFITLSVSDDAANWSDGVAQQGGGLIEVSDSNTLSDTVSSQVEGRVVVADDASGLADSVTTELSVSFNQNVGDSFTLSDFTPAVGFGYQVLADEALTLSDAASQQVGAVLVVTDDLNNWTDDVALTRQLRVSDTLPTFTEFVVTFPRAPLMVDVGEQLALDDFDPAVSIDYLILGDDSFTLNDAGILRADSSLVVSDTADNWADSAAYDLTILSTQLTVTVSDNANNWADGTQQRVAHELTVNDSLPAWNDVHEIRGDGRLAASDNFELADAEAHSTVSLVLVSDALPTAGETVLFLGGGFYSTGDSFTFTDSAARIATETIDVEDDSDFWNEEADTQLFGGGQRTVSVADVLIQDDGANIVRLSTAFSIEDDLSQSDAVATGFGLGLAETGVSWQDDAQAQTAAASSAIAISITDMLEAFGDGVAFDGVFISGNTSIFSAPSGGNGWAAEETTNRWAA